MLESISEIINTETNIILNNLEGDEINIKYFSYLNISGAGILAILYNIKYTIKGNLIVI